MFEKAYCEYRLNRVESSLKTIESAPEQTDKLKELYGQVVRLCFFIPIMPHRVCVGTKLWEITGNICLCAAVQTGALQWMQICVHRPDQELSGWVRGGEKNKPGCCGGLSESVGEQSSGKHDAYICTLCIYMSPVCLGQLGFLKSWWILFWVFIGSSGSSWVNLWAVLQRCLCFDWPRKTYRGLQQTTASRGSVLVFSVEVNYATNHR